MVSYAKWNYKLYDKKERTQCERIHICTIRLDPPYSSKSIYKYECGKYSKYSKIKSYLIASKYFFPEEMEVGMDRNFQDWAQPAPARCEN